METLYQSRLSHIDVTRLRLCAARRGWLLETNETMRAGFGRSISEVTVSTDELGPEHVARLFASVTIERDLNAPTGSGALAFASVPFARRQLVRLWIPQHVAVVSADGTAWLTSVCAVAADALRELDSESLTGLDDDYELVAATFSPTPDGYAHAVASAVEEIRHSDLEKVVLARRVVGRTTQPIDPAVVISRLHEREPACTLYAMSGLRDDRFVGASPELMISSIDGSVTAHPLAGTVALHDESDSRDYATWLLGSGKNLFEHRVVVDDIVRRLETRCDDVRAESSPSIVTLRSVAHLGTWIVGKVNDERPVSAVELLALLHPTPAVGGLPAEHAVRVIERLEPEDRGLYAGAVGWIDEMGSGEWWIAIRGVMVAGDEFTAWAGAGIVADSDPIAEREETRDKLASILAGLGDLPR